jgi:hypothetical protein
MMRGKDVDMEHNSEATQVTHSRTIQKVRRSSSVDLGQSIQIEIEFTDGQAESFRVPFERAPIIVHAIVQASAGAEKERKLHLAQPIKSVSAYSVQACEVLTSVDDKLIGISFETKGGFPVQVVMPKALAQNLKENLGQQLSSPGDQPRRPLS